MGNFGFYNFGHFKAILEKLLIMSELEQTHESLLENN